MSHKKVCTVCETERPINGFRERLQRGKPYRVAMCRPCERQRAYSQVDRTKRKKAERKRWADPETRKRRYGQCRKWRSENVEKNRAYDVKQTRKQVDQLTDSYIKKSMKNKNATQQEIKLRRAKILIGRINGKINKECRKT